MHFEFPGLLCIFHLRHVYRDSGEIEGSDIFILDEMNGWIKAGLIIKINPEAKEALV